MILLIENDMQYAESIGNFLAEHNTELDYAFNGISAFELASLN
ncbi:MAG TPA: two-component system response regulator, partial [Colwellia sp.]|nr:two-component system response regulator [Colwellia sp.]